MMHYTALKANYEKIPPDQLRAHEQICNVSELKKMNDKVVLKIGQVPTLTTICKDLPTLVYNTLGRAIG